MQPDSLGAPFKVANLGDPAGMIDEDHLAGITGSVRCDARRRDDQLEPDLQDHQPDRDQLDVTVGDYAGRDDLLSSCWPTTTGVVDAIRKGSENQTLDHRGHRP